MDRLIILYGSQTGNSQDLAERLWKRAKSRQIASILSSFDSFDMKLLSSAGALLLGVCSTTGQGDVPDNMAKFWKQIMRRSLPLNCLTGLEFATIGLGDSTYDKFNFTAKKLHKRLIQLGASPLLDICLCDEQHSDGIEGAFSQWSHKFDTILNSKLNSTETNNSIIYKYRILFNDDSNKECEVKNDEFNEKRPFYAKLTRNERVTAENHWQNVRLIELEADLAYKPGDVLTLRPSNLKQNIHEFLTCFSHLNLDSSQKIKIVENYPGEIEPSVEVSLVHSVADLVENYFDLNSIPKLSFFETFAQISRDDLEKEKLNEFLSSEGLDDLYNYCYRPRRTLLEVFHDFPKTCLNVDSLEMLVELVPAIKPRSFSIASSPFLHRDKIQLLVAVVEYKTRLYASRKGTCSYWLSTLIPEENVRVPVWIGKGSFALNWEKPVICIGPGTGVAPFRSIINERVFRLNLGGNYLYFGCRSKSMDFYFEKEWEELGKCGYLSLYPAFSRDQERKVYVQDLLSENGERVFELLEKEGAYVLIAGNSKRMPQDVMAILKQIVQTNLAKNNPGLSSEDVDALTTGFFKNLESKQRIQMETWS